MKTPVDKLVEDLLDGPLSRDSDGVLATLSAGKGTASLVASDFTDLYLDILDDLDLAPEDCCFLEKLSNGGEKGAGLAVLKLAIARAAELGFKLLIFCKSERPEGQARLRQWYLDTGLVKQTRLLNVFTA